ERLELLEDVLAKIAEPNRSLLLLHEGRDRSVAELAQQFDLSPEAVKARLKRTRGIVRQRLLQIADQEI
ncbi:MAG: SigE family RNA polymerase sigma factor, partial [Deltaproteobacteria bacterium]